MIKNYPEFAQVKEDKKQPKNTTINALLNYSKSLKVEKVSGQKMMINLN
jgi:hypothetical protein